MLAWLQSLDEFLFRFASESLENPFFDVLLPLMTHLFETQVGLYLVLPLSLFLWFLASKKSFARQFFLCAVSVGLADQVCYRILKPTFQRTRPHLTLENVELKTVAHSGYSFPSNHAANNFAFATVLSHFFPVAKGIWLSLAALVAFSRVYVGVHYPFDVLVGGILGWMIGLLVLRVDSSVRPSAKIENL